MEIEQANVKVEALQDLHLCGFLFNICLGNFSELLQDDDDDESNNNNKHIWKGIVNGYNIQQNIRNLLLFLLLVLTLFCLIFIVISILI